MFAGFKMCSVYVLNLDQMVPNVASGVNLQCGSQKVCSEAEIGNQQNQRNSTQKRQGNHQFHSRTSFEATNDQCIPWDLTINERIIKDLMRF